MATTGTFDFNIEKVGDITNDSVLLGANIIEQVRDMGDIIGIAIALVISLGMIALAIAAILGIPFLLIRKVKSFKKS